MAVRFSCPCGKHLSAPESAAGKPSRCPRCGRAVVVPARAGQVEPTLDLPEAPAARAGREKGATLPTTDLAGAGPGGSEQTDLRGVFDLIRGEKRPVQASAARLQASETAALNSKGCRLKSGMAAMAARLGIKVPPALPDVRGAVEAAGGRERYTDQGALARGGMGEVRGWLDTDLGRHVAVKRLAPEAAARPGATQHFLDEARMTARLEHPAIVPVHGMGEGEDGLPYFTMARLAGKSLAERAPEMAHPALFRAIRRVAEALDFAHDAGVLHLDVKPANIVLGEHGDVYLIDWGIARAQEKGGAGRVVGTPAYMSPEQAAGKELDGRTDVYSLGATLYHVLTGRPPYDGRSGEEIARKVLRGPPASPRRVARIPRTLAAIVEKGMARHPKARYRTAGELAKDLERYEAGLEVRALPDSLPRKVRRWLVLRPRFSGSGLAALVAVALGAAWLVFAGWQERVRERERAASRRDAYERNLAGALEILGRKAPARAELLEALDRAKLALILAPDDEGGERAAPEIGRVHLALARLEIDRAKAEGQKVGPVAEALAEVRRAEEVAAESLATEIAKIRREAGLPVAFRVSTDPPGEPVEIHELARDSVEPGALVASGTGELALELPTGGYLVLAGGRGSRQTRLPVWLELASSENREAVIPVVSDAPQGFVYIPPGWFQMGEEKKWTEIREGFYMAACELTWREYGEFLKAPEASGHGPQFWQGNTIKDVPDSPDIRKPDHPVFGVSQLDAVAYCEWLSSKGAGWSYRLPRSDEWEWSARGADGRTYPWGEDFEEGRRVNLLGKKTSFSLDSLTEPVGSHREGRSVFGCYQMADNLREWTDTQPESGSGETSTQFVLRGGAWGSPDLEGRCWFAVRDEHDFRLALYGARLVAAARTR
ncbi:MAG: SUMF1/EgtB/PvdO family nonheme iron enzyme [Planctomycetes bacterium]|nr:SUMF1/EgtB/PvdO family nonheme iron enzyme [Planctomycetota bacterium]